MKIRKEWIKGGWMIGVQWWYPYPPWRPWSPHRVMIGIGHFRYVISIGKTVLDDESTP